MSKKIKIYIDADRMTDVADNAFLSIDDLIKNNYNIIFNKESTEEYSIEIELDTPSSQAFMIFGGLYDPKTGLVYATTLRNRQAVIACDAVKIFSVYFNKKINKSDLTNAFINFKLSGKSSLIERDLTGETTSIIYKNLMNSGLIGREKPFNFYLNFLLSITSITNIVETAISYNYSSKNNSLDKELKSIENSMMTSNARLFTNYSLNNSNLSDITLLKSSTYTYIKNDNIGSGALKDEKDTLAGVLKINIDELLDTKETLVYSTDIVSTLRRNGFAQNVNKNTLPELKKLKDFREDFYDNLEYSIVIGQVNNLEMYSDRYKSAIYIGENISQLIYLNKTFRKLSK